MRNLDKLKVWQLEVTILLQGVVDQSALLNVKRPPAGDVAR